MAKRKSSGDTAAPSGHHDADGTRRIVEQYLSDLKAVRDTGAAVPETSYYPAFSNLLNAVGKTLKPKVRCVINISNQGAGLPDGGLFTADQFQRQADGEPKPGQLPVRGAVELKGTKPKVTEIAASKQVKDYVNKCGHHRAATEAGRELPQGDRRGLRLVFRTTASRITRRLTSFAGNSMWPSRPRLGRIM